METVYHSILKGFNWILAGLLSLLGFSVTSCGATDEYGSPYAEYELKGKVTDMNGDPIQGIEINYGGIYNNVLSPSYISEIYKSPQTQKDGSYDIKFEDSPMGIVRIIAKDIDGPENGSFETDSIDVKIEGFEGGKSWFHGKAEVNIPDIKLKEKKNKIWTNAQTSKTYRPRAFFEVSRRTGLNYMNCVHSLGVYASL